MNAMPHQKKGVEMTKRSASKPSTPLPQAKKQRRDFFGRPIEESDVSSKQSKASAPKEVTSPPFWYRYNEGYSNAVRREVRMKQFYDLLK